MPDLLLHPRVILAILLLVAIHDWIFHLPLRGHAERPNGRRGERSALDLGGLAGLDGHEVEHPVADTVIRHMAVCNFVECVLGVRI